MITSSLIPAAWAAFARLVDDILHVVRRHELRLLDVDRLAAAATAWMKSVWRARKAGVCSTSTTSATGLICGMSWTSCQYGTPSSSRTLARIVQALVLCPDRGSFVRRAVGLVEARLEDEQNAELVGNAFSRSRRAAADPRSRSRRAGDEEKGLVQPDLAAVDLHGVSLAK
jgi:hypothetical protein